MVGVAFFVLVKEEERRTWLLWERETPPEYEERPVRSEPQEKREEEERTRIRSLTPVSALAGVSAHLEPEVVPLYG